MPNTLAADPKQIARAARPFVVLAAVAVLTGCTSTVSPSSAPEGSTPAPVEEATVDTTASDELYRTNPVSIGEYLLLTEDVVAEYGLACTGKPIEYDDVFMFASGLTFASVIYATPEGLAAAQDYMDPCVNLGSEVDVNDNFPGIVSILIAQDAITPPDTDCYDTHSLTICGQAFPPNVYLGARGILGSDREFLSAFLASYIDANPLVQSYIR